MKAKTMEGIYAFFGLLLGVAGTAIAAYFKYRSDEGSAETSLVTELLKECRNLRDSITTKDEAILELQTEVRKLQEEVHELREEIERYETTRVPSDAAQILETLMNSFPKCIWVHEVGANNWFLSDWYAQKLHVARKDFWTPVNIFQFYPAKIAAKFVENDMAILQSGIPRYLVEKFPARIMEPPSADNPDKNWEVVKIPVKAAGRSYVIGICADEETNVTIIDHYRELAGYG